MYEVDFLSKSKWKLDRTAKGNFNRTTYIASGSFHRSTMIVFDQDQSIEIDYHLLKPDFAYFVHIAKDIYDHVDSITQLPAHPKEFYISVARIAASPDWTQNRMAYGGKAIYRFFFDDIDVLNKVLPQKKFSYQKNINHLISLLEEVLSLESNVAIDYLGF